LVLIVFFVIEGVASRMFALEQKRELSGRLDAGERHHRPDLGRYYLVSAAAP
jgi:hypothetical protein